MPKKNEAMESYKEWLKLNKKFEQRGLYGTDYYIKKVDMLEAKVKRLQAKLKLKGKGQS